MRRNAVVALLLLAVQFLLPVLLIRGEPLSGSGDMGAGLLPMYQASREGELDSARQVSLLLEDGRVEEMSLSDYLCGVVAAEMPASFEEEALKAQAVAARTYWASQSGTSKHLQADICADSGCCQAYISREEAAANWGDKARGYQQRIARAVAQTDGLCVTYEGRPIQALFFSSAPGSTVDAQTVWGRAVPYLVSVESPEGEEVPNYRSSVTLTAGNVERQMSYGYADYEGPSGDWTSTLESQHCLSVPLRKGISYTENERSAISGDIAMPTALPDFPDTIVHVDTPLIPPATPFKEEITQYGWFDVLGGQVLFPSAHIEKTLGVESWREDVLTRDSRGAITSVKEKGGPQTVILWGYSRRLPVAVIENASMAEVQAAFGDRPSVMDGLAAAPIPTQAYLDKIEAMRTSLPNAHVTTYTHIPGKGV